MSLIGDGPNLVLDFEMNKHKNTPSDTGEGELAAAKRLLYRVVTAHKGVIDVEAYDSLACNSPFINACDNLGVDAVIRVKDNYNLAIRKVKKITNKKKPIKYWNNGEYNIEAYESIFYMDGVESRLRFLKFAKKKRNGKRSQVLIVTTAMDMRIKTVYKIMKARWHIENRVFNVLKTYANLNHCFVHGGNAVEAILYLMFIASNLFHLFMERRLKNHINSQIDLVRLLNKGLYQLGRNEISILNST